MIFSKEFDRSLWLIIKSDKNNGERIKEIIKSIPEDVYKQIYIALNKFNDYVMREVPLLEREDICINGSVLGEDNSKYLIVVDMILHSLTITKGIVDGDKFNGVFELSLYAGGSCNNVELYGEQMLGRIYDYNKNLDVSYELVDTMFGKMVVYDDKFKRFKKIDFKSIPMDINMKDFDCRDKLIRVRKMY